MTKPWTLDGLAHAGPEHVDPTFAAGFDRKQGYPDPAVDLAVLRAHDIDQASTVVDLGAGTGQFALAAAPYVGYVVAVDISRPGAEQHDHPGIRGAQILPLGEGGLTTYPDLRASPADRDRYRM